MKVIKLFIISLLLALIGCIGSEQSKEKVQKKDWKLSMQSYTFHKFTVIESLAKCKELGLNFIEIYPGHRMGEGFGDALFGYDLTLDQQKNLIEIAKSYDVKIISSGVWTSARDDWEKVFAFAKNIDLKFISAEPLRSDWDVVESLATKYGVQVACHNHPNENSYWTPEILLDNIEDRGYILGSSADVGHFKRMGVEPVSALKELSGRVISLHFKDILKDEVSDNYEDVIWGTGDLDIKLMLEELKRQAFNGYFTIEYESNWDNNIPEIKKSIEYYNSVVEEIFAELK